MKRQTIPLGKRTARLTDGNKGQVSKTSGIAYAKQDREISFIL